MVKDWEHRLYGIGKVSSADRALGLQSSKGACQLLQECLFRFCHVLVITVVYATALDFAYGLRGLHYELYRLINYARGPSRDGGRTNESSTVEPSRDLQTPLHNRSDAQK